MRIFLLFSLFFIYSCGTDNKELENKSFIVEISELVSDDPLNTNLLLKRIKYCEKAILKIEKKIFQENFFFNSPNLKKNQENFLGIF